MDWIQAQSMARSGKTVARTGWPMSKMVTDNSGTLEITDERLFAGPYYPTHEDRDAADWLVVDETLIPLAANVINTEQAYLAADEAHHIADEKATVAEASYEAAKTAYTAAGGVLPTDPPPEDTLAGGLADDGYRHLRRDPGPLHRFPQGPGVVDEPGRNDGLVEGAQRP